MEKAKKDLEDAQKTLELEMYDTAANRSYYAIFHSARAILALDGLDYKKHSGVISRFQQDYIKTEIFDKNMSNIIKSAFDMRTESDYEDFYVISKADVIIQVSEAEEFVTTIDSYIKSKI
ncbi:MAG: HEPN domain-containing protein [Ruminococcaceae bacterium]|nr:HEPN domain-containing protein [Oscillospiraceae bacterium]